jgi:Protein of unknown function with PCYCGC motif
MKKLLIFGLIVVTIGIAAATISSNNAKAPKSMSSAVVNQTAPTAIPSGNHDHRTVPRVPAHHNDVPPRSSLPQTLTPEIFTGNVRQAYHAARDIPQTLAQLPCYCNCDMSIGHKSLHSCFEDEHGANCGICMGEALMAYNLQRQGLTDAQIRERIIQAYGVEKH